MGRWFPHKKHCHIYEPHEEHKWTVTRMGETMWAWCWGSGTRAERMFIHIEVHR